MYSGKLNLMKRQINVGEHRRGNQNGQSRETGNIWYGTQDEEKQTKNTTQYVLDATIRKQKQIM
jgi:hypothetical protein